ncbi:VWA domain-containing protein [Candidatus Saccharibacteria bacterium]|nr:VWA domain-containing protein [Candidatus Saccharibacteria bacterium]
MSGDKLARVKHDASELIESLLSDDQNRAALVNFNSNAEVLSTFTNDKDSLLEKIDALDDTGCTNYYQGFLKAEDVLDGYVKAQDREIVLLFLTDGYPNEQTPNEVAEYQRLKSLYPYLKVAGIQYEMGEDILDAITDVSDLQYIATMDSLNNVLFDAVLVPYTYSNFVLTDYIDDEFWNVESIDSVVASIGETALSYEGTTPKVTWNISNLYRSGSIAELTIDIALKDEYKDNESLYPTNKKETVETRLEDTPDEVIESENTPVLKNIYEVIYEGNAPNDCSVSATPGSEKHAVSSTVEISETVPTCSGYNFSGWEIATDGVKKLNDDYFKMPEGDVTLRATWTKVSIEKTMDGTVYVIHTLYDVIASRTNGEDSGINFATAPSATNGDGVNTVASTVGDEYPVYYFRGAVSDNNVRFADFCWKVVRTTSTGGVKLIYNGLPNASNGCTNTTSSTYGVTDIGLSAFAGTSYDSPAYVGYMRGNKVYTSTSKNVRTSGYVFGNDVSWNGKTYTLIDTYTLGTWSSEYTKLAYDPDTGKGYHYTCGNTSTRCTSVYYLNYMASSSSYVLTLTGGVDIEAAKTKMFSNETDSAIKRVIDRWYKNNLKNTAAESLLEDTVFCNDRTIYDGLLKSKNDTSAVSTTMIYSYYGPYGRNRKNNKNAQTIAPSLQCPNVTDAFTVNATNGNGALDYPVGLLTGDELTLAGHGWNGKSISSYLYTDRSSWTMSPSFFDNNGALGFDWRVGLIGLRISNADSVRPVVSLVPGTAVSDGDGSTDNPWVIE